MLKSKALLGAGIFFLCIGVYFINSPGAHADTLGTVTSYTIPTSNSYPYAITQGPDGNMWFTENSGNKIGKITTSGTITEYSLPYSNSGPTGIVNGPDGDLWFTDENNGQVGKITTSGSITLYSLPSGATPGQITVGPDGNLWVNDYGNDKIYRMSDTGSTTTYTLNNSNAYGVYLVSDPVNNQVWVGERNQTNSGGWITKFSMDGTQTDYTLPSGMENIYSMVQGNDDDIYFVAGGTSGHDYVDKVDNSGTFATSTDLGSGHALWTVKVGLDGNVWATDYIAGKIALVSSSLGVTEYSSSLSNPLGLASGADGNMWFTQYTGDEISKIGEGTITSTDADGDGLTAAQELQQGTSDLVADTTHDGLSDYVKSQWNTNRNAEFCNSGATSCAYPDPTRKNLYVAINWMYYPDPLGYSMEPTTTELTAISNAYAAHGINFQYDTGTYGSGGQVAYASSVYWDHSDGTPSVYDYKYGADGVTSTFDATDRASIWHYMLLGYEFEEEPGTSGKSTIGGPDTFISYGLIKDNQTGFGYSSFTTAIEGTMIHELGHNLCLSNSTGEYTGQSPACVFDGIDNSDLTAYPNYPSSLNYEYQMEMVGYSSGLNSSGDHNDWGAITLSDFNRSGGESGFGLSLSARKSHDEWLHEHYSESGVSIHKPKHVK